MTREELKKVFLQKIKERLENDYHVEIKEIQKNNNVVWDGLIIHKKDVNIAPTIYLNSFYEAFESGTDLDTLVEAVLKLYEESMPSQNIDMNFFRDYRQVKDRICFRLIHKERNKELLEGIPFVPFWDLAVGFYYLQDHPTLGKGSITIRKEHMELWNVNAEELMTRAIVNTPRLLEKDLIQMKDLLLEMSGSEEMNRLLNQEEAIENCPMLVLSNKEKLFGAAVILYPDVLDEIASEREENLYIIPSSIHETILLWQTGYEDESFLQSMIYEVNSTQVETQDVLSDSLYLYDYQQKKIFRCETL